MLGASKILLGYSVTALLFLAVDLLWLGVVAEGLYDRHLGPFLAEEVNWTAALTFYLIYVVGILIFGIFPGLERESAGHALLMGGLFGFFCYATYELTNLAVLEGWPAGIVAVDVLWGAALTGSVSLAGYHVFRWLA